MKRNGVMLILPFLLGIAIGAGTVWGVYTIRGPRVEIVEGYTTVVDQAGTAIGLATEPDGPGKGYSIAGAFWRQEGGAWHTSGLTCLDPGTSGQRVRMGVVEVGATAGAPGREVVVWLECLD